MAQKRGIEEEVVESANVTPVPAKMGSDAGGGQDGG